MKRIIFVGIILTVFIFLGVAYAQSFSFAFQLPTEHAESNKAECGGSLNYNLITVASGNVSAQNVFGSSTRAKINGVSKKVGQYKTFTSCTSKNSYYYTDQYPLSLLSQNKLFMYAKKDDASTTTEVLHVSGNFNPG